jgi:hypothetical protein
VAAIQDFKKSLNGPDRNFNKLKDETIAKMAPMIHDTKDVFALVKFLKRVKHQRRDVRFDAGLIVRMLRELLVKLGVSLLTLGTIGEWGAADLKRLDSQHTKEQAAHNASAAETRAEMQKLNTKALSVVGSCMSATLKTRFEALYEAYDEGTVAMSASIAAKFSLQCEESKKFYAGLAEAHVRDALSKA